MAFSFVALGGNGWGDIMRTRHDRATQLLLNCYDLGVGFRHEGDAVVALAPTFDGAGKEHPALQAVIDRYQPELCALVPRHGVQPDKLRPVTPDDQGDKLAVIRKGVEAAAKNASRKKSYGKRYSKPPVRKPAQLPVGYYHQIIEP